MSTDIKKEELMFNDSPGVSIKGQPILGTLEGYCADTISPTRNGRKYSEALWEKVFNSKIVKELFNCGGILGELDHPQTFDVSLSKALKRISPALFCVMVLYAFSL